MKLASRLGVIPILVTFLLGGPIATTVLAQDRGIEEQAIDGIRRLADIGQLDRDTIRNWVQLQVDQLAASGRAEGGGSLSAEAFRIFRQRFNDQYDHPANTSRFRVEFAAQTTTVASDQFARRDLDPTTGWALAHVLLDMRRQPETLRGMIAGLKAPVEVVRYLCAQGLATQRSVIAADKDGLAPIVAVLRTAGVAEESPEVLGRIYDALAHPDRLVAVFDAYIAIFDKRLERRRAGDGAADAAETTAFEVFRTDGVLDALDATQKPELVRRLAAFLRFDAERYNDATLAPPTDAAAPDLGFFEREVLERRLDAEEAILASLVGEKGGRIREALANGGYGARDVLLREAYKWVGNPDTNERGPLNEAPWDVPVGAP